MANEKETILLLKLGLLRLKPKFACTNQMLQKLRAITKLTKTTHSLNTETHKRLNVLITKSLTSPLSDPLGQPS